MTTAPAPHSDPTHIKSEFSAIGSYLDAVMDTVSTGHMPDMAGLDKRITALCASVEKADRDIQQTCLSQLQELLSRLDKCEAQIRTYHEKALAKAGKTDGTHG